MPELRILATERTRPIYLDVLTQSPERWQLVAEAPSLSTSGSITYLVVRFTSLTDVLFFGERVGQQRSWHQPQEGGQPS